MVKLGGKKFSTSWFSITMFRKSFQLKIVGEVVKIVGEVVKIVGEVVKIVGEVVKIVGSHPLQTRL